MTLLVLFSEHRLYRMPSASEFNYLYSLADGKDGLYMKPKAGSFDCWHSQQGLRLGASVVLGQRGLATTGPALGTTLTFQQPLIINEKVRRLRLLLRKSLI